MSSSSHTPESTPTGRSRGAARAIVLLMVAIIVIETSPRSIPGMSLLKRWSYPLTQRLGLWQGEWPLFAPNPVLNNAWVTAEIYAPDGTLTNWNSIFWGSTSGFEKFYRFRHMNFYNNIAFRGEAASHDFLDYIARTHISPDARPVAEGQADAAEDQPLSPPWRIVLVRSQLNMIMPDDGSLPSADETTWVTSSETVTSREYRP